VARYDREGLDSGGTDDFEAGVHVPMTSRTSYPSLQGRAALVTGGASGIGESVVRGFVRNGARVALIDVDRESGQALRAELGSDVVFIACDLTDVQALRAAVGQAESQVGPVRALVNNAANDQRYAFDDVTPEQWDASQAINLRQQFFVTQAVVPGMRAAGGGSVVNMSSVAWRWGAPDLVPYTTAKAGILGLTRSLGAALGEHGIRVNAVAPGAVMTERQMRLWHTPESRARSVSMQALHSEIVADDIADAVLFLSADDSRMITKQCLTVDGGAR
jgi:NAD(P)-dependent dehydrogenase (short-subunit alcohol dehydrogenase family)